MDLALNHSYNTNLRLNIMLIFRNIMIVFMSFIALYMLISWYIVNESLKAERNDIEITPLKYGLVFEEISFAFNSPLLFETKLRKLSMILLK